MTQHDESGSRRITHDPADQRRWDGDGPTGRDTATRLVDGPTDRAVHTSAGHASTAGPTLPAADRTDYTTPAPATEVRPTRPAKTSAAAVFGLVFGLAALFCALTAILSPAAVLFGIIGLILALVGIRMAKKPGVTGRGVAIGGLVTALLGVILGGVVIGGLTAVVNDKTQLDRIQRYIDDARANLPSTQDVRNNVNTVTGN